jgi:DNA-binding transcriptional ArsR family regulator
MFGGFPIPRWLAGVADPVRLHILHALYVRVEATASDLGGLGGTSGPTLRRHLDALLALGLIRQIPGRSDGETPGRPPCRFRLSPEVREGLDALTD